ncbi:cell wall hydrolase [Novosphingobium sp. M1R2S20]|uniref:Cell wall hydrolase n=1 Tax=Novosphingobium rhizovicinum TaxID=3228928 RepID=A0ABV3RDX6_9SPHN
MIDSSQLYRMAKKPAALGSFLVACLLLASLAAFSVINMKAPALEAQAQTERRENKRVRPSTAVPEVGPVTLKTVQPADAQAFNAAVPFSSEPNPPAKPFKFPGSAGDRSRALHCLAAAVLYEAGDDPIGQKAVAQVVLNRVRHPAFPKSVCGVVFQGSERKTGCQFTFTCDGALKRSYAEPFWHRARIVADAALSGSVYKPVGQATHYHTDWVVPYWSSSLDKVVAVDTHLFFRWTGWWGTPPAFRYAATGVEPQIQQLASRFPEHHAYGSDELTEGTSQVAFTNAQSQAKDDGIFFVSLSSKNAEKFPALAARTCGDRAYCWFVGWTDPSQVPSSKSADFLPAQRKTMSFSYLNDRENNFEKMFWNCRQFKRPAEQCLRGES